MLNSKWFLETTTENEGAFHSLTEIIYSGSSPYQRIDVIRTASYGKCLVLDGKMQSSEADEFIYHEALVHPALALSDSPRRVLIAGGGEGATAREALKYAAISDLLVVDLDSEVVEVSKSYLAEWHGGAFEDKRVKVVFEDAREFIMKTKSLDVIIADLPEPTSGGPALTLYTQEFYEEVRDSLTHDGIFVTQATSTAVNNLTVFSRITNTLKKVFPIVRPYVVNVPSFFSPWGFVFSSNTKDPLQASRAAMAEKLSALNRALRFYDHETHVGLFSLPKYLRDAIEKEESVITDSSPLSFY